MDRDLAARVGGDEDLAALALGDPLMLPGLENTPRLQHLHGGPALGQKVVAALGDGLVLAGPEQGRVGEITVLGEEIADDRTGIVVQGKQGVLDGDGRAAKQPRLERHAGRRPLFGVVEQGQPLLLLGLRGQGQGADGGYVDRLATIERADARQEISQGQDPPNRRVALGKGGPDLLGRAPLPDELDEGFPGRDLVGGKAVKVLDQRRLDGGRVVAGLQDADGYGIDLNPGGDFGQGRRQAPRPGHHLEMTGDHSAVGDLLQHQHGDQDAALTDRGPNVGDVRGWPAVVHVEPRDRHVAGVCESEFHRSAPCLRGEPAPPFQAVQA